jgi:hypothetical protein
VADFFSKITAQSPCYSQKYVKLASPFSRSLTGLPKSVYYPQKITLESQFVKKK